MKGYTNLIGKSIKELDLMDGAAVARFFDEEKPEYVFLAAAHVGGIVANNIYRADFIYRNLQIQNNVIGFAYKYGVKKLLFLGSTCIYPAACPQPGRGCRSAPLPCDKSSTSAVGQCWPSPES